MRKTLFRTAAILLAAVFVFAVIPVIRGAGGTKAESDSDVCSYSYEVTPVLAPFPYCIFVKTDNPDPESFMLVDKSSVYFGEGDQGQIHGPTSSNGSYSYTNTDPGTYYVAQATFADVDYENVETRRVAGGYIFVTYGAFPDGGELVLKERTSVGNSILHHTYQETDVTIPCPEFKLYTDYLIDAYTDPDNSFFENMDAIQAGLNSAAIYPRGVYDSSKPNEARPYPLLATSPYYELTLNEHYNAMFESCPDGILLYFAYPMVLDSLGVPNTMRTIALSLEPEATVEWGSTHAFVNVTYNGETHSYGGAGRGGNDPLFTEDVVTSFTFDGAEGDLANSSIESFGAQFDSYSQAAAERVAVYRDLIAGDTYKSTIAATGGTWARVATERGGFGTTFTYLVPRGSNVIVASQAWVDGRYIDKYETINLGVPIDMYTDASIILHNVTYTDYYGQSHTQDVIYDYYAGNDDWEARFFYTGGGWYTSDMTFPDELILSRSEVEAIKASWTEGARLPQSGLVYDGTEYPGTPFGNVLVEGLEVPAEFTAVIGHLYELPVSVLPSEATYPQIMMTAEDTSIVSCGSGSYLRGLKPGTTTVTVRTNDGGFTKQCVVTVTKDDDLNAALNAEGGRLDFVSSASKYFYAAEEEDRLVGRIDGVCSYYSASLDTVVTLNEGDVLQFDYRFGTAGSNWLYMFVNNSTVMQAYGGSTTWRTKVYTAQESGEFAFKWRVEGSTEDFYLLIDNVKIIRANPIYYTVRFVDADGTLISEQQVEEGQPASAPVPPVHEGYSFIGWDVDFSCVTSDLTVTALYEQISNPGIPGDVNCDGAVTMADLSALSAYMLGKAQLTAEGKANADVNCDGSVNAMDLPLIYKLTLNF